MLKEEGSVNNETLVLTNLNPQENKIAVYRSTVNDIHTHNQSNNLYCESTDTLKVFYEIENDTTIYTETIEVTVDNQDSLVFSALKLLKNKLPSLDFDNFSVAVIQEQIENKNVTINLIDNTKALFRLKYDNIEDVSVDDFVVIELCMKERNACYNLHVNLRKIIEEPEEPAIYVKLDVHNAISPNGDGKNDYFDIIYNDSHKNISVQVFSRQGNIVWKTDNYDNETNNWKGTDESGNLLAEGTYFYIIQFTKVDTDKSESTETHNGYLVLKH